MRVIAVLAPLLAIVLLAACGPRYHVEGQTFETKQAALDHAEKVLREQFGEPPPLPAPIAGPAVLVAPRAADIEVIYRREHPGQPTQLVELIAGAAAISYSVIADVVESRAIFTRVERVSAPTPDGVTVPERGYLLWLQQVNATDEFLHIMAHGESETTELTTGATPEKDIDLVIFVEAIEAFVRSHPAE